MSAEATSSGARRPAILAVVAVVAIAAMVAVLVTVRGDGPEVIRLGAAASGGDATMEAMSDEAMPRMAWVEHRFVLGDGARFAAGEGSAWRLEAPGDLRAAALDLARRLGIESDEVTSPWGDGSLQVGADDGRGPGLWVGPGGDWSYHDPSGMPEFVCAEPAPAAEEGEREELVEELVDGDEVRDDVLIDEPCAPVDPPSGVPDEAAARAAAASFFAGLDLAATPRITEVYADEWSAWVTGRLPLGEADSDLFVSAAFGQDGLLTSASGTLARPVAAGLYPTIDAEAAVARLSDPQGWFGGGTPMPADTRLDVQVDLPADAAAGPAPGPDTPVEAPAEVDPADPADDDGGEVSILPVPEPDGEPEIVEVTLVAAEPALLQTVDVDGTIWLLPGVRFRSADGGEWQVLTVADEYLDADAADAAGDGSEPGDGPAPTPEPDPGTEPGGAGEPGDPGTGEPIDPDAGPAPDEPDTGPAEEVAHAVVGTSEADAIATIEEAGFEHRIVRRDGEWFAVTDDWRTDRINLEVEGGTVVKADVG